MLYDVFLLVGSWFGDINSDLFWVCSVVGFIDSLSFDGVDYLLFCN